MKKKLLCLLLTLVMAVSCLAVLSSCGGGPDDVCEHKNVSSITGKCKDCGEQVKNVCKHTNVGEDGVCVDCGKDVGSNPEVNYAWDETDIIFMMTNNSNNGELPSGCKRYLAGEDETASDYVDELIETRNSEAYEIAKVNVIYDYYDDTANYNWSKAQDHIKTAVDSKSSDSPDIFCNFVYDMVNASLKHCFINLFSQSRGKGDLAGANYFEFSGLEDNDDYVDSGNGYMYEYMRSLSLSEHKMYCLASDYFTDLVRAFFVVPVNINLINTFQASSNPDDFNYDYTGDGDYTIEDFYELVRQRKWNYETLAAFCNQGTGIFQDQKDPGTQSLDDRLGFAISGSSGLSASGMLYTTSVVIINRQWNEEWDDYTYYYPTPDNAQALELVDFTNKLRNLFETTGVISVTNAEVGIHATDSQSLTAIRNRFSQNMILFGGVICVGSLEYEEYQNMKDEGGFGVVPVPLYRTVNPTTGEADRYLTQIHNIGRIGGINNYSTKFAQCSAFLDYQSTHSTEILDEYYNYKLQYDIAGGGEGAVGNREMLSYIRENVRSSFDKAFEDAIGKYFVVEDSESNNRKWHTMILNQGYKMTDMAQQYADNYNDKAERLAILRSEYDGLPD